MIQTIMVNIKLYGFSDLLEPAKRKAINQERGHYTGYNDDEIRNDLKASNHLFNAKGYPVNIGHTHGIYRKPSTIKLDGMKYGIIIQKIRDTSGIVLPEIIPYIPSITPKYKGHNNKVHTSLHDKERITSFRNPKLELQFLLMVIKDLINANIEYYAVGRSDKKVAICHKGWTDYLETPDPKQQYFALENKKGRILVAGKNVRNYAKVRSTLITMANARFKKNKMKLRQIKQTDVVKDIAKAMNFKIRKQNKPFK